MNKYRDKLQEFKDQLAELLESATKHDAEYDAIESKLEQVRMVLERGGDVMDDKAAGKQVLAQGQLELLSKQKSKIEDALSESFQALREHLRNAQDLIARAAGDQLQEVKSSIAKVLLPFSNGIESAERLAGQSDVYQDCIGRVRPHYGSASDPREEGKLVAKLIDQLLAGGDFFACCRKQKAQA